MEGKPVCFSPEEIERKLKGCSAWRLTQDGRSIEREYLMKNFSAAVDLIHQISFVAEALDHHPDLHLTAYRKLNIVLSTHAIGGISEKDFILAAQLDALPKILKL
ncbi:MAG: 4a-hydroxytetrahydrobiopterin dehydratase [Candidatus Omnitrophica bacterium]|nr:4a-hydroxytetrahydrobiopterin dehydratase [Candidatus Omnitrophota bacterium]